MSETKYHAVSAAIAVVAIFLPPMVYGTVVRWGAFWIADAGDGVAILAAMAALASCVGPAFIVMTRTIRRLTHA